MALASPKDNFFLLWMSFHILQDARSDAGCSLLASPPVIHRLSINILLNALNVSMGVTVSYLKDIISERPDIQVFKLCLKTPQILQQNL